MGRQVSVWGWESSCDSQLDVTRCRGGCPKTHMLNSKIQEWVTLLFMSTIAPLSVSLQFSCHINWPKPKYPQKMVENFGGLKIFNWKLLMPLIFAMQNAGHKTNCLFRADSKLGLPWPCKLTELSQITPLPSQPSLIHMLLACSTCLGRGAAAQRWMGASPAYWVLLVFFWAALSERDTAKMEMTVNNSYLFPSLSTSMVPDIKKKFVWEKCK